MLLKEPDLEENDLRALIEGDQLKVTRQSLEPDDSPVTITAPDGTSSALTLTPAEGVRSTGAATISQMGLYRSEEHTSELQSLMRISYAAFCSKKKNLQEL